VNLDGKRTDAEAFARMKKHLSGNDEAQELSGAWFTLAQHGYNTTQREGVCLHSEGNQVVVVEGRIDNHEEITRLLKIDRGNDYVTILQNGYKQRGIDFFRQLSGPFASAILDTRMRTLRLLRDPIGLRPLYYSTHGSRVVFGSDVRQVLGAETSSPTISEQKLIESFSPLYLIDESESDESLTMFESIRSVPYGSSVAFSSRASEQINRYWEPPRKLQHWQSPTECVLHFRELFSQVIKEQIDAPFGIAAELSGGIDSGCVVSAAGQMLAEQNRELNAYTAVFGSQSPAERMRVDAICKRYPNVLGHMINCDQQIGYLENSEWQSYRPSGHPSRQNLPATFVQLAELAVQDKARILLSGEGADWYLEGTDMIWDSLIKSANFQELSRVFNVLRHRSGCRKSLRYLLNHALPSLLPGKLGRKAYLNSYYDWIASDDVPVIFTPSFRKKLLDSIHRQRDQLLSRDNLSCWSQTLEHELVFPPNHVWQGVPVELEMRLPYLDRRIMEFGLTVPPEFKFNIDESIGSHYGCRKSLQRQAFRDIVPQEVITAQQKEIYSSPVTRRLRQELPVVISQSLMLCEMGVLDNQKLEEAASAFLTNTENKSHPLIPWLDSVLSTENWLRATMKEFPGCRLPKFCS